MILNQEPINSIPVTYYSNLSDENKKLKEKIVRLEKTMRRFRRKIKLQDQKSKGKSKKEIKLPCPKCKKVMNHTPICCECGIIPIAKSFH